MKKVIFLVVCLGLLLGANAHALDKFWVSLGAENEPDNPPILLMQIDELGNVTIPPFVAVSATNVANTAIDSSAERSTALTYDSSGNILLYYDVDDDGTAFRVVINKDTLVPSKPKKVLKGLNDPNFLQVTQPSPKFLAVGKVDSVPLGWKLDAKGFPTGSNFRLNPRAGSSFGYSISADGSMAISALAHNGELLNQMYLQPLGANGLPSGDPAVVIEDNSVEIEDLDITNLLSNGRRFVVYSNDVSPSPQYFLQVVDGTTGQRIGSPILLSTKLIGEVDQQIAIDPQGRFVLFNIDADEVGCDFSDPVFYLKLDPNNGTPQGSLKEITDCDVYTHFINVPSGDHEGIFGIDILKAQ